MDSLLIKTVTQAALLVRGDLVPTDFESWLYQHDDVQPILGDPLYFEAISTDYHDSRAIGRLKHLLDHWLDEQSGPPCRCSRLPSSRTQAILCEELQAVESMPTVARRTPCLQFHQCPNCDELWYVAVDTVSEQIGWQRSTPAQLESARSADIWPPHFMDGPDLWPSREYLESEGYRTIEEWRTGRPTLIPPHPLPDAFFEVMSECLRYRGDIPHRWSHDPSTHVRTLTIEPPSGHPNVISTVATVDAVTVTSGSSNRRFTAPFDYRSLTYRVLNHIESFARWRPTSVYSVIAPGQFAVTHHRGYNNLTTTLHVNVGWGDPFLLFNDCSAAERYAQDTERAHPGITCRIQNADGIQIRPPSMW